MSKCILQIDVSKSKSKEEDLLTIRFVDEDVHLISFSKLVGQSKYIRDKYRYCEALELIQQEIDEVKNAYNISDESIKLFFQLIQDEKISIPIEHYKDIYRLSEYFCIPIFTSELDNIFKKELFDDLSFTIQILHDSETSCDDFETKLIGKIENFLIERIDECIENSKFKKLPIPTIYRILKKTNGKFDHNSLVDFIFESAESRFIMIKFVELNKLRDDKIDEMIQFIEEQEEPTKKLLLENMPFNLSFIKNMKSKYEDLFNQMKETKQELNRTKQELNPLKIQYEQKEQDLNQAKQELNQTKQEFKETKQELNQTKQELNQAKQEFKETKQELNQTKQEFKETKQELNQTKQELNQTKQELNQAKQEFKETKQELNQTKQEFKKTKQELNQTKQELNQIKQELNQINQLKMQYVQKEQELNQINQELSQYQSEFNQVKTEKKSSIIVCGRDKFNQLVEKPNNKTKYDYPIIYPPMKLSIDPSSILSYSSYCWHSVLVMNDGSLKGIGDNRHGRICSTLQKTVINDLTEFCIKDPNGSQLAAISAVCCNYGTLYMLSKSSGNGRQLVLCDKDINFGDPVFIDIGNHYPVSLFGGHSNSAAIGSEGEVIFINRNSVKNSPNSEITAVSLPEGEKASSIACCNSSVVVLSSNGRVYESPVEEESGILKFLPVSELSGQEIVCVSGIRGHFLAVSKEGRVFGCGSNGSGKIGLGEEIGSVSTFTEITSLNRYKIRAAYAGFGHSLFETREGKIISCGWNENCELLISSDASKSIYSPTETSITDGSSFCIAGSNISVIFIGNPPPPNSPNMRVQQFH